MINSYYALRMHISNLAKTHVSALLTILCLLSAAQTVYAENPYFSADEISQWRHKSFEGNTQYSLVDIDGKSAIEAGSKISPSSLICQESVDLSKTPYLNWTWKVDQLPSGAASEKLMQGDDYGARIYIIFSTGFGFWNAASLNYVWSRQHAEEDSWINAFSDKVTMLVVESGESNLKEWQTYKRDVAADVKRYMGKDISKLKAVAIMTDSDNTQDTAKTYYGDIWFSAE